MLTQCSFLTQRCWYQTCGPCRYVALNHQTWHRRARVRQSKSLVSVGTLAVAPRLRCRGESDPRQQRASQVATQRSAGDATVRSTRRARIRRTRDQDAAAGDGDRRAPRSELPCHHGHTPSPARFPRATRLKATESLKKARLPQGECSRAASSHPRSRGSPTASAPVPPAAFSRRRPVLMEAAVAVVCRGGGLRPGGTRAGRHGVGVVAGGSPAPAAARRRALLVASLGEPLTAQSSSSLGEGAAVHETPASCSDSLISSLLKPSESPDQAVQVDDEEAVSTETLPPPDNAPTKTVHVKFVLQKQCAFGQRFLVVGEDPALGIWNPVKAAALDWSEDHVWTVKKELPADRSIEFKFLLQDPSGHVHWQPGPNRILHLTDTSNTLVVCEDWDDTKNQQVSEEIGDADVILSGTSGVFQEDELQLGEEQETDKGVTTEDVDGVKLAVVEDAYREMMGSNDGIQPQLALDKHHKIPDEFSGKANIVGQNGNHPAAGADDYSGRKSSNGEDAILHKEGEPVQNRPGLASVLKNDMAWATKALHQVLRSLGFQFGTTKT
uniref:CBM20 domain-containing protein n=1 Tax=Leersia perrieri TaxID=77586 RepID=A0A0D9V7Z0_9ORYZ